MNSHQKTNGLRKEVILAGSFVAAGMLLVAVSLFEFNKTREYAVNEAQQAQAQPRTDRPQPNRPGSPDAAPESSRPHEVAPQPARPDDDAQKAGAKPALPPAPAEKVAPPIKPR